MIISIFNFEHNVKVLYYHNNNNKSKFVIQL
jgi:hypothetical protein